MPSTEYRTPSSEHRVPSTEHKRSRCQKGKLETASLLPQARGDMPTRQERLPLAQPGFLESRRAAGRVPGQDVFFSRPHLHHVGSQPRTMPSAIAVGPGRASLERPRHRQPCANPRTCRRQPNGDTPPGCDPVVALPMGLDHAQTNCTWRREDVPPAAVTSLVPSGEMWQLYTSWSRSSPAHAISHVPRLQAEDELAAMREPQRLD